MITDDPFAAHAVGYDDVADSALGRVLRERVHASLERLVERSDRILDLGCGTGLDAQWLAPRVAEVVATEPSLALAQRARSRLAAIDNATVHALDVRSAAAEFAGDAPFDVILANFGVVNCVEPTDLAAAVSRLLATDGHLVLVPMPSFCPLEQVVGRLRGRRDLLVRRRPGPSRVQGYDGLLLGYPNHRDLAAALPMVELTSVRSLGLVLPPFEFRARLERRPRTLRALSILDRAVAAVGGRFGWGDHLIIVFEHRRRTGGGR